MCFQHSCQWNCWLYYTWVETKLRTHAAWPQRSVQMYLLIICYYFLLKAFRLHLHFGCSLLQQVCTVVEILVLFSRFHECACVCILLYCLWFWVPLKYLEWCSKIESRIWYFTKFQSLVSQNILTTDWPIYLLFVEVESFVLIES
jgi:hypothetical protein